ncbi:RNA chaperone ProQ [Alteromonas facilis]|uniref:RNA chaperone ProQ n=1 Tax=Alteromonas facilis TaxID=2048004 RepID=UPI000C28BCAB|nr:RNA chaperone ProQ [Alteromonas facilis]
MESTEKFANSKEVIAFLAQTFPDCFTVSGAAKPLKIGIFQDLAEALKEESRLSKTLLRSSLRHYTNSWRYLESITEGAHRVNLQGEQDAVIEAEHAEHAQQQLSESKAAAAEKRKEQKKTQNKRRGDKPRQAKTDKGPSSKKHGTNPNNARSKQPAPQKLTSEDISEGTRVTVKLGKVPMPAVITEVAKDGIHVQLDTGMVVKVAQDALRLASPKRS